MLCLTTTEKIRKILEKTIVDQLEDWCLNLSSGGLHSYERALSSSLRELYNQLSEILLPVVGSSLIDQLQADAQESGCRKIEIRPFRLRIASGHQIKLMSPYVKVVPARWDGSRHLLVRHWSVINGYSPGLYDKVAYFSSLAPSYDLAHQALNKQGVALCLSSVRDITNSLAQHCFALGEEHLCMQLDESAAGKRIVLSIDGGRTRTREYRDQFNDQGNRTYETPWREPKLFVIDILDEQGRTDRCELPIYGCRFAEEDILDLLGRYLKKLRIEQAKHVQIIADGASWIWSRLGTLLDQCGVPTERITQTLDYYHASKYIYELVESMPKRIGKKKRENLLKEFKTALWEGKSAQILAQCQTIFKRPSQLVKRWMNYFEKHQNRTQYALYQENKLMCGSGIVESGVRRIINLRFKNAATFWEKENVEKLYFLRATLLAKRWGNMIDNLVNLT